jgi:hypothetical protein
MITRAKAALEEEKEKYLGGDAKQESPMSPRKRSSIHE